jgi:hypothetical protein
MELRSLSLSLIEEEREQADGREEEFWEIREERKIIVGDG